MTKKRKRKFTSEAWEDLVNQVKAQKSEPEKEPEKEQPVKVTEIHVHNNVPIENAADAALRTMTQTKPGWPI